jgi:hypothetical protein
MITIKGDTASIWSVLPPVLMTLGQMTKRRNCNMRFNKRKAKPDKPVIPVIFDLVFFFSASNTMVIIIIRCVTRNVTDDIVMIPPV